MASDECDFRSTISKRRELEILVDRVNVIVQSANFNEGDEFLLTFACLVSEREPLRM